MCYMVLLCKDTKYYMVQSVKSRKFGGLRRVTSTLVKAECKIKQLENIVGSSSDVSNPSIEIDKRLYSPEWLFKHLISTLDRVSDTVEAEHETYPDEKIEHLKTTLSDLSHLIWMVKVTFNQPPILELVKKLDCSFNHLTDVFTDAVEFRSVTSEISLARVHPSIDKQELETVKSIIERGKKRAMEVGNN